jgi:prophage regulatory protein
MVHFFLLKSAELIVASVTYQHKSLRTNGAQHMRQEQIIETKPPEVILRRAEVERITGLGRSSIYSLMATGQFPRAIHLSDRAVGWIEREVSEWQRARIAQRDSRVSKKEAA